MRCHTTAIIVPVSFASRLHFTVENGSWDGVLEEWTGSHCSRTPRQCFCSHKKGSADGGVCRGRKDRARPTWVHSDVSGCSLQEPAAIGVLIGVALSYLVFVCLLLGGMAHAAVVQSFLEYTGGFLCVFTQTHTAMLELVTDV